MLRGLIIAIIFSAIMTITSGCVGIGAAIYWDQKKAGLIGNGE